jgi:hypothetical protein
LTSLASNIAGRSLSATLPNGVRGNSSTMA